MKRMLLTFGLVAALCVVGALRANTAMAASQSNARVMLHAVLDPAAGKGQTTCDDKTPNGVDGGWSGDPNADPPIPGAHVPLNGQGIDCAAYTTTWPSGSGASASPGWAWVMVGGLDPFAGLKGVEFGLIPDISASNFAGSYMVSKKFAPCNDGLFLPTPGFPQPNTGARVTWNVCGQTVPVAAPNDTLGAHIPVGVFYIYAYNPDGLRVGANPATGTFSVGDCAGATSFLPALQGGSIGFGGHPDYNPCEDLPAVPTRAATWGQVKTLFNN